MAEAVVRLRVDATGATRALSNVQQQTNKLSVASNRATKSLAATSTAAKGLGASLAASLGPLITLGAAFATVGNAIGTFTARERDVAILTQGLKNLGAGTAQLDELQEAADRLGNQTLFNQEEFTRGFNLLTSFRNIGVDSYTRVAQAAADIAQVNQVDVSTSFMQLAKALQDPERNLSNLNRSGIAFTKQQTEVIKQLMKTNKVAEAHAMILDIVEESYNKLSQAASEGFAGNVDTLGETFRDFSETLGKALEPALIQVTKGLTELIKVTTQFINSPIAGTAAIFSAIALAAKGTIAILAAVKVGLLAVGGAAGVAAIALNSIPFVAAATLLGALTTKIISAAKEQREFNKALKDGDEQLLKSEFNRLFIERQKLLKRIREAEESSNKKALQSLKRQLEITEESLKPIKEKLKTEIELNKKNKSKTKTLEENKEIQEEINKLIKDDLAIAIAYEQAEMDAVDAKGKLIDQLSDQKALAQAAVDGNLEQVQTQQEINALVAIHGEGLRDIITKYIEGTNALKKQKDDADELKDKFDQIGEAIESSIKNNLRDAITGAKSFGEAMTGVLNKIRDKLLDKVLDNLFGGFGEAFGKGATGGGGGGIGGFIGKIFGGLFANGGQPPVNKISVVGERGPELFVPRSAGTVVPNQEIGGSSITNNISISVDATNANVQSDNDGQQFGEALASAIQAEIVKQKRSGGLLR